jgi:hypothetical protein
MMPRRAAVTTAAHAPDPQARVIPAPRSQTRKRRRSGPITWTMPIFARSGNSGLHSNGGPTSSSGTASALSTKNTACGLPTLTAAGSASMA